MVVNLLDETRKTLSRNGRSPDEVLWIGTRDSESIDWLTFEALANFEYDNGFGGAEINQKLVVVGRDWWLERGEYDGSEWWEFKMLPVQPESTKKLSISSEEY